MFKGKDKVKNEGKKANEAKLKDQKAKKAPGIGFIFNVFSKIAALIAIVFLMKNREDKQDDEG